jgi:hypothetical protein
MHRNAAAGVDGVTWREYEAILYKRDLCTGFRTVRGNRAFIRNNAGRHTAPAA